ncbi:DUF2244 domain-containing protein [Massilia endophytica]|uniref:DUF2244 domain-containing protein n=1 Tax=Massilia endophytica TaxID=2899220 RepID=UPI001E3A2849|nr:DUF2244 domain-containing protein [Massilia endophytica]UGQ46626.1 DUF2244 domain-containing protein [Massilia endophytica]
MQRDMPDTGERREWLLKRNCSLTPRQTIAAWSILMGLSAGTGIFFALHGAWLVLAYSALEMAAVSVAFLVYCRHAADHEHIVLEDGSLLIEKAVGGKVLATRLDLYWMRIEAPGELITLEARGVKVDVGGYLPEASRRRFARQLREEVSARGMPPR